MMKNHHDKNKLNGTTADILTKTTTHTSQQLSIIIIILLLVLLGALPFDSLFSSGLFFASVTVSEM